MEWKDMNSIVELKSKFKFFEYFNGYFKRLTILNNYKWRASYSNK